MGAEQSVSAPRRNQLAASAVFRGPQGGSTLSKDARRGNPGLKTAGNLANVGLNIVADGSRHATPAGSRAPQTCRRQWIREGGD